MQLAAPRILYAMPRPQSLRNRGIPIEQHGIVELHLFGVRYGTGFVQFPHVEIVQKREMIARVPIIRVEDGVEIDCFEQRVDWL